MEKHTPGPWRVEPDQPSHGAVLCVVGHIGQVIVRTPEPMEPVDHANAQLIAAAPDLLAALQDIAAEMAAGVINPHCVSRARAAIAKAVQS